MKVNGMNVFISGPMTGIDANNVVAFLKAHELLIRQGAAEVYDPAYAYYSDVARREPSGEHSHYMRKCIHELSRSCEGRYGGRASHWNLMVQLPGWEKSEGCATEYEVAKACGIVIVSIGEIDGSQG